MKYDNIIELIGVWKIDEAIEEIERLPDDDDMRYPFLSMAYDRKNKSERAMNYANTGIEMARLTENTELLMASLAAKFYAMWRAGYHESVEIIYTEMVDELDKMYYDTDEMRYWYAMILHVRATALYERGEYPEAKKSFELSLTIRKKIKDISGQSASTNNLGMLHYYLGEYNKSLEYFMQSVENEMLLGNPKGLAITYSNIADVHRAVGEYNLALKFMNLALETTVKNPIGSHYEAHFNRTLSKIYWLRGEYDMAHSHIQHALNLEIELKNKHKLMETLYLMIIIDLEKEDREEAYKLFSMMNELEPFERGSTSYFYFRVAEASIIKSENRLRAKLKAQEMFEEILKEEPKTYDLFIYTVLNLVELLFLELQSYDNPDLLDQVKLIVQQIETIAKSQNSTPLKVEALLLKSQVSLVELKMNETFKLLDEVKEICRANEFTTLYSKAETIQRNIEEEIEKWNNLSRSNAPLFKRISESNIIEYLRMVGKIIS